MGEIVPQFNSIAGRLVLAISLMLIVICALLGGYSVVEQRKLTRLALDRQAARGTEEVSSHIATVELAARDTGGAAAQIRSAALDLSRQADLLRAEVGNFLGNVRTGTEG